jgi:thiamine biosynthesis lipoprotein
MEPFTLTRLACRAMGTRFELVLYGAEAVRLRAAGEEVLAEIERLDAQLSLYHPPSELRGLNARAAREPVALEPRFFRLLQQAKQLGTETEGAFDLTVAPLLECWGFQGGTGAYPDPATVEAVRGRVGWSLLELDESNLTVRFRSPGVRLDLGAIGKGYALERAAAILRDHGVRRALLHGGTSSVYGLGAPPGALAWEVAIDHPCRPGAPLARVALRDQALSVSAVTGKFFLWEGQRFGHIVDPRTGWPVRETLLAAVVLPSPTVAEAWSTALLVLGPEGLARLRERRPEAQAWVASSGPEGTELRVERIGLEG